MPACTRCGEQNPDRARFCLACGAELAAARPAQEERKVVSVLFVDLVGFTARSDDADPEDVRATLAPYHARVRDEIERHGGSVEKFVGDAVMAVFGAPTAHEDDAERAVRAGLAVLEATAELGLEVRAAVNTGEAVVDLSARPERGEAVVAGDVVNTAARLQSAAETGTLVVGELAFRTTEQRIDYEPREPVAVKGKAEPVPLWRAVAPRSRFGVDAEPAAASPLVGRGHELALLTETYARVLREQTVQLVTLVGEPGVGKTRLLRELFRHVDSQPELVYWRQGRCLPYGDGIAFWALGEIVKGHAGILESDEPEAAAAKLAESVLHVVAEPDEQEWIRARLAPLVGLEAAGAADRDEAFTAWRSYLEAIAAERPLVVVVEDAHWADEALLAFLEHVLDWSLGVPLLLLCTARPELLERHPSWGGGKRNSTTVSLSPLSPDETARLLQALLAEAVLPAETQALLLERAGGNPLYAEHFVRMLTDRGILERRGRALHVVADGPIPVPETVHALITARLDTLGAQRKTLLQDAAVVGKVFWAEALVELGGRSEQEVLAALVELAHVELVRPARLSSLEGQREFAFTHALVRDVAYGQIPRPERARRHRIAAEWLERVLGDRAADHADMLAHHACEALDAARAAGADADEREQLRSSAVRLLTLAGKRASALDVAAATSFYDRALELAAGAERPALLVEAAGNDLLAGRSLPARARIEEALPELRAGGDPARLLSALDHISRMLFFGGEASEAIGAEGDELAAALSGTDEAALHWSARAGAQMMSEQSEECLQASELALAAARAAGTALAEIEALQYRGISRIVLGDVAGQDDIREALRRAIEHGSGMYAGVAYVNLGYWTWWLEGPGAGASVFREGLAFSERRGAESFGRWAEAELLWALFDAGEWDEALRRAEPLTEWAHERENMVHVTMTVPTQARILLQRGAVARAAELSGGVLDEVLKSSVPQIVVPALTSAGAVAVVRGERKRALELLGELEERSRGRNRSRAIELAGVARVGAAAGDVSVAERILADPYPPLPRAEAMRASAQAVVAEAAGDASRAAALHREAARRWRDFGGVFELAYALLGAGRCGGDEAALAEARALFERLGAAPRLAEIDRLTGGAAAAGH